MKTNVFEYGFKLYRTYYNDSRSSELELSKEFYDRFATTDDFNSLCYIRYYNFFTKVYKDKLAVYYSWVITLNVIAAMLLVIPSLLSLYLTIPIYVSVIMGVLSLFTLGAGRVLKVNTDNIALGYMWEKSLVEQSLVNNNTVSLAQTTIFQ